MILLSAPEYKSSFFLRPLHDGCRPDQLFLTRKTMTAVFEMENKSFLEKNKQQSTAATTAQ